jgi:hypothetical protein
MADQDDVRRMALALPEVTEELDRFAFRVRGKGFVWVWLERGEPKATRQPNADVIAVRVANETDKDALLALDDDVFFTEPHYNGFPAVLVRLPAIDLMLLREVISEAWRCQAPKALAQAMRADPETTSGAG